MPELPEVEEVRRTLEPHLLGVRVTAVEVRRRDFVSPADAPLRDLCGQRFTRSFRHGKKMFLIADKGQVLVVHLGMSGRVDCVPRKAPVQVHTHVIMELESGIDVRFRDPRRFGGVWYYTDLADARQRELGALGKDALEIGVADLAHWKKTRGRLKQRLLSQRDVAGLGNIYVDEALWCARLHPMQRVSRLTREETESLVREIHRVLLRSMASGGTTLRDYRNVSDQPGQFARQLHAYGRGGEPCLRCRSGLRSTVIATRTTVFCPRCQKCH